MDYSQSFAKKNDINYAQIYLNDWIRCSRITILILNMYNFKSENNPVMLMCYIGYLLVSGLLRFIFG